MIMKTKKNKKLFVWHDSLVDYSSGVMFAFASSVDEARKLIMQEQGIKPDGQYETAIERDLKAMPSVYSKKVGFAIWGGG